MQRRFIEIERLHSILSKWNNEIHLRNRKFITKKFQIEINVNKILYSWTFILIWWKNHHRTYKMLLRTLRNNVVEINSSHVLMTNANRGFYMQNELYCSPFSNQILKPFSLTTWCDQAFRAIPNKLTNIFKMNQ